MNPYAKYRNHAGLSVRKAAKAIGVAASTIVAWEKHGSRPNMAAAQRAAEVYGVTLDQLAGRAPFEPEHQEAV